MMEIISMLLPWMVLVKFLFTFHLDFLCPKLMIVNILYQQYLSLITRRRQTLALDSHD